MYNVTSDHVKEISGPILRDHSPVKKDNSRSIPADILKVLAIFGVVFIHCSFILPSNETLLFVTLPTFRFCVPIFILMWAYFAEKSVSNRDNKEKYFLSRFFKLLIPFLFWSMTYFLISGSYNNLSLSKIISMYWSGYGWSGQYYFILLFQLTPVFVIIRTFNIYSEKMFLPIIILSVLFYSGITYSSLFTIGLVNKIGDRLFIYWLPYVILGITFARTKILQTLTIPLTISIFLLLLIPLEVYFLHSNVIGLSPYLFPSVFVASFFLLVAVINFKSNSEVNPKIVTCSNLIAKNTLGIFCINPLVILILKPKLAQLRFTYEFWGSSIIFTIVTTVFVMILCLALTSTLKLLKLEKLVTS